MALYLVAYDFHKNDEDETQDYTPLYGVLEKLGDSKRILESVWLVNTGEKDYKAKSIKDHIKKKLYNVIDMDYVSIFVVRITTKYGASINGGKNKYFDPDWVCPTLDDPFKEKLDYIYPDILDCRLFEE